MEFNALPGKASLYGVRNGQGPRVLIGGMVASAYVTQAETDGNFSLHMVTGGIGAGLPLLRHADTLSSIFILDGVLELTLNDRRVRLSRGDSASIPPGTAYAFRMLRPHTVAVMAQTGAALGRLIAALGQPFEGFIPPETGAGQAEDLAAAAPGEDDTQILGMPDANAPLEEPGTALPDGVEPFALAAGEGTRLLVADQLFTFAAANAQTGDRMLTLQTEGPMGDMIPPHKHLLHDEMFFCLDGAVRLRSGEAELELAPGDFLFVPRGTPHAYQFLKPYTRMVGWLCPGVFEDFFHCLGEPTELRSYPQTPGPFRFDRVMARINEFDMVPLGGPAPADAS